MCRLCCRGEISSQSSQCAYRGSCASYSVPDEKGGGGKSEKGSTVKGTLKCMT